MSKCALAFLLIAVAGWASAYALGQDASSAAIGLRLVAGTSTLAFLLAMIRGRRIKFDPLLR